MLAGEPTTARACANSHLKEQNTNMKSWPHAPSKIVNHPGTYFVTGSTYHKERFFSTNDKLDYFYEFFLETCFEKG